MDPFEIEMKRAKETKGTFVYEEEAEGEPPVVRTLYIQKWKLNGGAPDRIKVTIEAI